MISQINAVLILLAISSNVIAREYNEQSLRNLFTSQQERQEIDNNRTASTSNGQVVVGPSSVQINGIVKRSDGKNIVWVNGKSTMENSTVDGVKVYSHAVNSKDKVPVMVDGRKIYLKPGETWSEEIGVSGAGD